jgi:HSP20 family protein
MSNLTRWNPFAELASLPRELERLEAQLWGEAPQRTGAFVPATEVEADANAWYVRMALPGIDPKDVQIEVVGNTLTVRGERKNGREASHDTYLSEIAYGRFERMLSIPRTVDAGRVSAAYTNGMLELTLPVSEAAKPRRIEIGVGNTSVNKAP